MIEPVFVKQKYYELGEEYDENELKISKEKERNKTNFKNLNKPPLYDTPLTDPLEYSLVQDFLITNSFQK